MRMPMTFFLLILYVTSIRISLSAPAWRLAAKPAATRQLDLHKFHACCSDNRFAPSSCLRNNDFRHSSRPNVVLVFRQRYLHCKGRAGNKGAITQCSVSTKQGRIRSPIEKQPISGLPLFRSTTRLPLSSSSFQSLRGWVNALSERLP